MQRKAKIFEKQHNSIFGTSILYAHQLYVRHFLASFSDQLARMVRRGKEESVFTGCCKQTAKSAFCDFLLFSRQVKLPNY